MMCEHDQFYVTLLSPVKAEAECKNCSQKSVISIEPTSNLIFSDVEPYLVEFKKKDERK